MSFAEIEARAAASVLGRLTNADAVIDGGAAVAGIFDLDYALAAAGPLGMASTAPALTVADADVPADPVGKTVVVRSVNYTVAESRPDGTGLTILLLAAA